MTSNAEFFQHIATEAEALRQELRARVIPPELRDTVEMVAFHLRQAHHYALMVSKIPETVVAAVGGE